MLGSLGERPMGDICPKVGTMHTHSHMYIKNEVFCCLFTWAIRCWSCMYLK